MAHNCPECYALCHCGGDIDDLLLNCEEDINGCTHSDICQYEDEDDFDYDDYEDDSEASAAKPAEPSEAEQ